MQPLKFPQANRHLNKPVGWTDDQCETLHCYGDAQGNMSKWRMSWRERLRVLFTGTVWLNVCGFTHPPVSLFVSNPWPVPINQRKWCPKWLKKVITRRAISKAFKAASKDALVPMAQPNGIVNIRSL